MFERLNRRLEILQKELKPRRVSRPTDQPGFTLVTEADGRMSVKTTPGIQMYANLQRQGQKQTGDRMGTIRVNDKPLFHSFNGKQFNAWAPGDERPNGWGSPSHNGLELLVMDKYPDGSRPWSIDDTDLPDACWNHEPMYVHIIGWRKKDDLMTIAKEALQTNEQWLEECFQRYKRALGRDDLLQAEKEDLLTMRGVAPGVYRVNSTVNGERCQLHWDGHLWWWADNSSPRICQGWRREG